MWPFSVSLSFILVSHIPSSGVVLYFQGMAAGACDFQRRCAHILTHAIAHGGRTNTVRESALNSWLWEQKQNLAAWAAVGRTWLYSKWAPPPPYFSTIYSYKTFPSFFFWFLLCDNRFHQTSVASTSIFNFHLRKLLWMYCPGYAGVKGNDWTDRLAG